MNSVWLIMPPLQNLSWEYGYNSIRGVLGMRYTKLEGPHPRRHDTEQQQSHLAKTCKSRANLGEL